MQDCFKQPIRVHCKLSTATTAAHGSTQVYISASQQYSLEMALQYTWTIPLGSLLSIEPRLLGLLGLDSMDALSSACVVSSDLGIVIASGFLGSEGEGLRETLPWWVKGDGSVSRRSRRSRGRV